MITFPNHKIADRYLIAAHRFDMSCEFCGSGLVVNGNILQFCMVYALITGDCKVSGTETIEIFYLNF